MAKRSSRTQKKKRIRQIIGSIVGVLLVAYFLYHTIEGERGWFAMLRLEHEVRTAEGTLGQLRTEREELEHRTDLLRNDNMDPDLLEEQSRKQLNYSKPDEIVVLTPEKKEEEKP